jgi:hypothetical protein
VTAVETPSFTFVLAVHEAGHAVVALALGFAVREVRLGGDKGNLGTMETREPHRSLPSDRLAIMMLAGGAAARKYLRSAQGVASAKTVDLALYGDSGDLELVRMLPEPHMWCAWRDRAGVEVVRHWKSILRVAEALAIRRRLLGHELLPLVNLPVRTRR